MLSIVLCIMVKNGLITNKMNPTNNKKEDITVNGNGFAEINNLSEVNLVAPYRLVGELALSVDNDTTFLIFDFNAALMIFFAP